MKTTTLTFRFLKRLHLIESEEKHGRINPFSLVWFAVRTLWRRTIFTYAYKAYILEFAYKHHLRPAIWRAWDAKWASASISATGYASTSATPSASPSTTTSS